MRPPPLRDNALKFLQKYKKEDGEPSVCSYHPLFLATLAFFSSSVLSQPVGSWSELQDAVSAGGSVELTGDIAFKDELTSSNSLDLSGGQALLVDGATQSAGASWGLLVKNTLTVSNIGSFTTDEKGYIVSDSDIHGGFRNFSSGTLVVQHKALGQSDVIISLKDVVFANNGHNTNQQVDGGGFHYVEDTQGSSEALDNLIEFDHVAFYNNAVMGYGAGLLVDRANEVTIKNSTFQNNRANAWGGAATFIRTKNIEIEDTSFFNNSAEKGGAIYVAYDEPGVIGANLDAPFETDEGPTLTIRAVNRDVIFSGNQAEDGADIYMVSTTTHGTAPFLNLSAKESRKIEFNGEIYLQNTASFDEPDTVLNINPEVDDDGEVVLNNIIRSSWTDGFSNTTYEGQARVHLHHGILTLGNPMALSRSRLIVDGTSPTLNLTSTRFGDIPIRNYHIGYLEAPYKDMRLSVDVDLEKGIADTLSFGSIKGYGATFQVNHWNVIADVPNGTQEAVVSIAEKDEGDKVFYSLTDSGRKATGALYIYDVEPVVDPDGWYEYENTDGRFRFTVAGYAPEDPDPQPEDFNPEVYGGTLGQKVAQLLQHEISYRLFDTESSAEGQISGSIEGGTLNMSVSHFDDIDFDYYIALFETRSRPVALGSVDAAFGVYGGFVSATSEGQVNNIDSIGAYAGVLSDFRLNDVFLKTHANLGYLQNDMDSKQGGNNGETDNLWVGVGASVGYRWLLPRTQFVLQPSVDVVYTYVNGDDFTTGHDVDVEVDAFHGWEVSPGLRLEYSFGTDQAWHFYSEARYVWTDASNESKAVHLRDDNGAVPDQKLPDLRYGDFAEMLLGVQAIRDDWTFTLGFDGKFGETNGLGLGAAAEWSF